MGRKLLYRVGKKVGVFRFDPQTNQDLIETGRIVARRLTFEDCIQGNHSFKAIYAVRLSNGRVIKREHEELWTKIWKGERYGQS